jgi:hypothetical protein
VSGPRRAFWSRFPLYARPGGPVDGAGESGLRALAAARPGRGGPGMAKLRPRVRAGHHVVESGGDRDLVRPLSVAAFTGAAASSPSSVIGSRMSTSGCRRSQAWSSWCLRADRDRRRCLSAGGSRPVRGPAERSTPGRARRGAATTAMVPAAMPPPKVAPMAPPLRPRREDRDHRPGRGTGGAGPWASPSASRSARLARAARRAECTSWRAGRV